jgi:hypothetical protein
MHHDTRIQKYLNAVNSILEGKRNTDLYNLGLSLRGPFGLAGNELESALAEVNHIKCVPPLPSADVKKIVYQVDRADKVPLGKSDDAYNVSNRRNAQPVKQFTVNAATTSVPVAELLAKKVSFYRDALDTTAAGSTSIGEILDTIRTGGSVKEQIEAIRKISDKKERNKQKIHLPAVIFSSEPQEHRRKGEAVYVPNGIMCLDVDDIPAHELEATKEKIASLPYVLAVMLSVSGTGLCALVTYEDTPNLKNLLAALQADFCYPLDPSCSDVSRLRFTSLDENLIIKDEVRPAVLSEWFVEIGQTISSGALPLTHPLNLSEFFGGAAASTPSVGVPTIERKLFPTDLMPSTLRNIAIGVRDTIGLKDSSTAAIAALAAASGLIGSSSKIQIKPGYTQPAHLFAAIVAKSGQAKSGTKKLLLSPLHERQNKWFEENEQANGQYKASMAEWKATKKKRTNRPTTRIRNTKTYHYFRRNH